MNMDLTRGEVKVPAHLQFPCSEQKRVESSPGIKYAIRSGDESLESVARIV